MIAEVLLNKKQTNCYINAVIEMRLIYLLGTVNPHGIHEGFAFH